MTEAEEDLLGVLQAHGQRFLDSFSSLGANEKKRKRGEEQIGTGTVSVNLQANTNLIESEEWNGCHGVSSPEEIIDSTRLFTLYCLYLLCFNRNIQVSSKMMIISPRRSYFRTLETSQIRLLPVVNRR